MRQISNIVRSEGDPKVLSSGPSSLTAADRMAKNLGWFSFALGLVELAAPTQITRALGVQGKEGLVRAFGVREIGSGLLSLSPDKQKGLWSRVAGDGLDMATLLAALKPGNPKRDNVMIALIVVSGIALLDIATAQATTSRHARHKGQRRLYRDRSGFPQGIEAAKGAARDFRPADMRAFPMGTREESRPPAA